MLIEAKMDGCGPVATDRRAGPAEIREAGRHGPIVAVRGAERIAVSPGHPADAPALAEGPRHAGEAALACHIGRPGLPRREDAAA